MAKDVDAHQDPAWDSARRQIADGLLSVIMPAHNLGGVIGDNLREVFSLFKGQFDFEIVVIDDGSSDTTRADIEAVAAELPEVRPVYFRRNTGKGAALKSGFAASRGNYVLLLDADLDLPPRQAARFFDIIENQNADVVIGSKRHPRSTVTAYPWHRKISSAIYYAFVKFLVGLPTRDTQTGMKLLKREALEWTIPRMLVKRFAFDLEMLALINERGFRIAESPIELQSSNSWGFVRPTAVRQILNDTLAVFYRLRLLKYYQSIPDSKMPDPLPLVSVVIAFPAPTAYLDECIENVRRQAYGQWEVILLPDEATGREWPDCVSEIPTGKLRPAEKRNIGIEKAEGSIVAFLDDDTFPSEGWMYQAVLYFSDPTVAAVGGPASTPGDDPYLARLGGRVYANPLVSGKYRYRYEPDRVREVDDYPSCNLFVRKEVLEKLGGFRTDFWPGEDTYLCLDIVKKLQLRIVYDPRVHAFHHRRKLFMPHLRQIGRYGLHRGYFARRFPDTSRRLSYMIPSIFVVALVLGGFLALFHPTARTLYFAAVGLYAFLTFVSSAHPNPATWLLTWLGVVLTHITYGARFIAGLLVSHLPGEVRTFDHPSEKARLERDDGGLV